MGRDGKSTLYNTTGATYFVGSTPGVVGDLAVGQRVSLELSSTTALLVTKVTICPEHVFGTVTLVTAITGGDVLTVAGFHGTTYMVTVSGTTTYTSGGAASTVAAVVVGAKIDAVGLPGTASDSLNASSVNVFVAGGHGDGGGHGHGHSRH